MGKALEIKKLSKVYQDGTQALKNISLTIQEGDFFALLGANGAGKTTTIGILTSLVTKTSGEVKVFDHDLDTQLNQVKSNIGVVPQEFNFNIFEKVIDIVVQQAGYYGIPRKEALERADVLLDQLGLSAKKDSISRNLSGGMKRRLMIARALIHKPRLLILDEPTAGVDVELRRGMWDYLRDLNQNHGVTILLTTHYLEEVEQLCQRAAIIKQGKIVKNDLVKNLLASAKEKTFVIESKSDLPKFQKVPENMQIIDKNTLEISLPGDASLNKLIKELDKKKIIVDAIRPKSNRLEELFLDTI